MTHEVAAMMLTFTSFLALKDPALLASLGLSTAATPPPTPSAQHATSNPETDPHTEHLLRQAEIMWQEEEMRLPQEHVAFTRQAIEDALCKANRAREEALASAAVAEAEAIADAEQLAIAKVESAR
jgi:hypothetical protein